MYTIKEASARSGVGIPLLRAWERRYGVVSPTRTPSGYRLYDDEAIRRLTAMRELIEQGWSAQQAAQRVRAATPDELGQMVGTSFATTAGPIAAEQAEPTPMRDALIERLVAAARDLDVDGVEAALDDAFAAVRFERAVDDILMPALRRIGAAWEHGDVTVAGEHATSQAVLRRLATAFDAAGAPRAHRPVLVGLGPGARHEFGALAFAIAARRAGLPVVYLGPDLPVESWVSAANEADARATVIAVPRRADVERAIETVTALCEARPKAVVAVGGREAARVARATGTLELPDSIGEAVPELVQATSMVSPH